MERQSPSARQVRRKLAKQYDTEANNLEQMSIFAKEGGEGTKSTHRNLQQLVKKNRRRASTARIMAGDTNGPIEPGN